MNVLEKFYSASEKIGVDPMFLIFDEDDFSVNIDTSSFEVEECQNGYVVNNEVFVPKWKILLIEMEMKKLKKY